MTTMKDLLSKFEIENNLPDILNSFDVYDFDKYDTTTLKEQTNKVTGLRYLPEPIYKLHNGYRFHYEENGLGMEVTYFPDYDIEMLTITEIRPVKSGGYTFNSKGNVTGIID